MRSTKHSFLNGSPSHVSTTTTGTSFLAVGKCLGMLALLTLVLFTSSASAQVPTGAINGTVVDPQGLPVEGASVTLTNQGTNYTYNSATGSSGGYQFSRIDYGVYSVKVSKEGFRQGVVENIKLDAATTYSVPPVRLEVGAKTEIVTVEAGAETVNTMNAEITGTTEKRQIEDLPILDRNPLNLLSLQVGVANSGPNGQAETTINGQRASFSTVTLDGINIQDNFIRTGAVDFTPNLPFLSQAEEFTVTEQNGDVEKGGSSGVSLVTPKGANTWHGEGLWNYRSNGLGRANDWFNDASGVPVPRLLRNQGGGNIGGPIWKNKLFIYGYYELLRLKTQTPNNTTTLSPAIEQALTSSTPTLPFTYQPLDRVTGLPSGPTKTIDLLTTENTNAFRDGTTLPLPTTFTLDPTMLKLIARVPTKSNNTRIGDGVNLLGYQFNARNNDSRDNYGFRADYNLNSHNTISGTWSYNRNFVDRPDIDTSFNSVPQVFNDDHIKFLSTAWRWNPSANLTNEARFGFNLAPAFFLTSQSFSSGSVIDSGGFPFTGPDPNFLPQGRKTHTWVAQDNANWVHGNHVIKFGTQFQRVTIFETNSAGIYPDLQLGFSGANSTTPVRSDFQRPAGTQVSITDYNDATALLASAAGLLSNISQTFNVTSQKSGYVNLAPTARNLRQNNLAFYAADSWRVTRKLTVNYGVRWEYFSPVDEKNGLTLLPVIPAGSTATQTLLSDATVDFAGGPSKRKLYNSYWKGFSPNLGVAWDPFGNGKTAVRAGFSMNFVNDEFFTAAENAVAGNAGLSTTLTAAANGLAGPTVSNPVAITPPSFGIPTTFSQNANIVFVGGNAGYAIDPNLRPPYVEQWNLSVQRDLGAGISLTIGYVGNHGVGLFRAIDVNQLFFNSNGFLADFNKARQNGFNAVAAGQPFDPLYGQAGGCAGLPVFNLLFACGGIDSHDAFNSQFFIPSFVTLLEEGQIGTLVGDYHAQEWDTGNNPGPSTNNPINFFTNPWIMGGDLLKNSSFSNYHAGYVEVRRRLSSGFYMQANYTFGKVLTDYGPSVNNDQSRFQPYLDNARPQLEKSRASFDFNHQFKANFTYELPFGKGHRWASSNKLVNQVLGGWQTGSIFTWQSGAPFSIISGQGTFNRAGLRSSRNTAFATLTHQQISGDLGTFIQNNGTVYLINPKLVSPDGTGAPSSPQLSCAPAVTGGFCNPQPGEVGNLQLYAFTGPAYFDWDLSAAKSVNLTEKIKLTFRAEAFNLLNHPVFAPPFDTNGNAVMNINDLQFGQSTSTISQPRVLQLSLSLKF